jgi:hypothetical protein
MGEGWPYAAAANARIGDKCNTLIGCARMEQLSRQMPRSRPEKMPGEKPQGDSVRCPAAARVEVKRLTNLYAPAVTHFRSGHA